MSIRVMTAVWDNAGVQGSELLVLLALADWADDGGICWPAMSTLSQKARISERSAQRACRSLAEKGLLLIDDNAGPKGANRYMVLPAATTTSSGRGDKLTPPDTAPEGMTPVTQGVTPVTPGGDTGVTRTVIEPPIEPSEERERAGADETDWEGGIQDVDQPMADDRKALKALKLAHPQWPTFAADSVAQTERAFLDHAPGDRAAGLEHWPAYIAHVTKTLGRGKVCAFSTYWREKRWEQLPPEALEPEGGEAKRPDDYAPPFGPAWSAWRIAALLAGPDNPDAPEFQPSKRYQRVWMFQAPAADRRGQRVGERWHGVKDAMEPVDVDSELFALWRAEHDARGWPWLPDIGAMRAVWFPKGGPAGLDDFSEAVRSHAAD